MQYPRAGFTYKGSLAYSFNVDGVHYVQLHGSPFYADEWKHYEPFRGGTILSPYRTKVTLSFSADWGRYGHAGGPSEWLRKDFSDAAKAGLPIVVLVHDYDIMAGRYREAGKESPEKKKEFDAYARVNIAFKVWLLESNVSAIFCGHRHSVCRPSPRPRQQGSAHQPVHRIPARHPGVLLRLAVLPDVPRGRRRGHDRRRGPIQEDDGVEWGSAATASEPPNAASYKQAVSDASDSEKTDGPWEVPLYPACDMSGRWHSPRKARTALLRVRPPVGVGGSLVAHNDGCPCSREQRSLLHSRRAQLVRVGAADAPPARRTVCAAASGVECRACRGLPGCGAAGNPREAGRAPATAAWRRGGGGVPNDR